ncbi:tRNA pseudouridine synthase [Musa troglodytarum]|uniref:tRNA pseudouridine synthase n=1 Tax=Musa troglodytarum TaxID=320322 RepID=A0A9E7EZA6_9LILI|nr:tRNA pseudouridine synthase [Musa troglodytarum]
MASVDGRDLVSDLQAQVLALRNRVEELEKENERLCSQLSRCRCSKDFRPQVSFAALLFNYRSFYGQDGNIPSAGLFVENSSPTNCEPREKPGCQERSQQCARRYVALKIMYFGQRFYGFASEAQMDPTIESEIFKALERTKLLIGTKEDSRYSRCGRTDKGVSSTGQVISLYLRSNLKDTGGYTKNHTTTLEVRGEIDYVRVLNRVLPGDIRVIGWCPVPTDFHSSYNQQSPSVHFHQAMQQAAMKFIGEYDFRNFCKMDAANVNNYRRRITFFDICSLDRRSIDVDELWAMTIKGSAFLWHQVRCMVAVLFMVGHGFESPDVIDVLLDTKKTPRKPQYNMAPELPLILRFCEFEDLEFICSSEARRTLHEHLKNEVQRHMLQAAIFNEALSCLSTAGGHEFSLYSGLFFTCAFGKEESAGQSSEFSRKNKGHIPLLRRATEHCSSAHLIICAVDISFRVSTGRNQIKDFHMLNHMIILETTVIDYQLDAINK